MNVYVYSISNVVSAESCNFVVVLCLSTFVCFIISGNFSFTLGKQIL